MYNVGLKELRGTSVRTVGVPAEILRVHLNPF
jgi:hypothetical protein